MEATRIPPVEVVSERSELALESPSVALRRIGPGRLERGYQARIGALEQSLEREEARERSLEHDLVRAQAELETAARIERGLQKLTDRMEGKLETSAQREKRLILALGAIQKENELLRRQLALAAAPALQALPRARARERSRRTAPRPGWVARILGRRPRA